MTIHLLPPEVASQIAAGEVIERPASVVKELVENALDAGAHQISVTISEAGRRLIEVADNGCGIPGDELALAVSRHATSKLSRAEDLFHIATLGFRGEALASIGSVSTLTITSRTKEETTGARLRMEAGQAARHEKAGAPVGTVVRVENLFFNLPARLKFLKTDVTERRAIDALLTRYALAYPDVRFKLNEGRNVSLQTSGDGKRREILAALYGVEAARDMLEVQAEEQGMDLSGFISPISLTRSNRREITFFINGRWVQNISLASALLQAYHTLLMVGRYPLAALFLDISPEDVDVNVHPAKAEVRFREQDRVFSFVQRAVRRTLLAYLPVPLTPSMNWRTQISQPGQIDAGWELAHDSNHIPVSGLDTASSNPAETETTRHPLTFSSSSFHLPLLRLIGQIGATYLVAEGPDGLYLIDQHAAHERVLFERLMAQHNQKNIPSQSLLTPVVVQLPPASEKLFSEQLPVLQHFGFEVEPFGPGTYQVRSIPTIFARADPAAALYALIEDFEEDETPLQAEVESRIAGRVCKRLAVKAGQILSQDEQQSLLNDLESCSSPRTCPHGRPTMIHLSVELLERQFGRRGAI